MICECAPLQCLGHSVDECRWQIMRDAGWLSPQDREANFQWGHDEGVFRVYAELLHKIANGETGDECKAEADRTKYVRDWMKATWPHIEKRFDLVK
jgi:hypothetical protein